MPSVRYRFNQALVIIDQTGQGDSVAAVRGRVPVLRKTGQSHFFKCDGFLKWPEGFDPNVYIKVKIPNIEAYTFDDFGMHGWQDIPPGLCALGAFNRTSHTIVIFYTNQGLLLM